MRFPNTHGERIVFVARDHLWTVAIHGGAATRLSDEAGQYWMPRYSPDGKWIAFTASFHGNADVYVMPAGGGTPRRLTFHADIVGKAPVWWGPDDMVVTWTPDSSAIVFLSRRQAWNTKVQRLYSVSLAGGLETALPLNDAGLMTYGADGHTIAYTRTFTDFRPWKRYYGGLAPDIFLYDLISHRQQRITDWKGTDTAPMLADRKVYFLSDRDKNRRANLWVYDRDSRETRQLTHFADYDIDFPSLGGRGTDATISFQQGGKLWLFNLASERLSEVPVDVADDGALTGERMVKVGDAIRATDMAHGPDYALSPDGSAAAFSARGNLFVLQAAGPARNLSNSSGADEEHPAWSPDGSSLAYVTDADGEQQVAVRPAAGGAERLLTHFKSGYLYTPRWSPDGRSLIVADGNHHVWLLALDGGAARLIAEDPYAEIHDACFSYDGKWIAYSALRPNQLRGIHLVEVASGKDTLVSSPMNSDHNPQFSQDGRLLYFISNRNEQVLQSESETDIATLKSGGIYVATLGRDAASPFAADDKAAAVTAHLDLNGLMRRALPLPLEPAEVVSIDVRGDRLYYQTQPPQLLNGDLPGERSALRAYDMKTQRDALIVTGLENAVISTDGRKLLYKLGKDWHLSDAAGDAGQDVILKRDDMEARVDPRLEWHEMFDNAWRLERDLYYSATMDGADWPAVRAAYDKLLPLIGSEQDFLYLIGQLQGEIGSSHTYYDGPASETATDRAPTPLLGADYALDPTSGRYRFAKIYQGDNTRPAYRSPLTMPGLQVREGDFLLAVNGRALRAPDTPDGMLASATGPLTLTVASSASDAGHQIVVEPLQSELSLREFDWTERNRTTVERLSGGRVAYLYLSDMSSLGTRQFIRQFYPQLDKQALIIDVRWNNGGFTTQLLLERLRRTLAGVFVNREGGKTTLPDGLLAGPKITLINHYSASDGDQFPYFFREYGLGKVIGQRTWGGVRGILGPWPLRDGTTVNVPKDVLTSPAGLRIIENVGTNPDIEVDDVPGEFQRGHDTQLETAVHMLTMQLDTLAAKR